MFIIRICRCMLIPPHQLETGLMQAFSLPTPTLPCPCSQRAALVRGGMRHVFHHTRPPDPTSR